MGSTRWPPVANLLFFDNHAAREHRPSPHLCEKNRDGKVVSMSIILVFVDDFMHVWMGPNGGLELLVRQRI